MILAAGFGNRMKPLSDRCPKPLMPIIGRPAIDYTIEHLKRASVSKIGVNTHYQADRIKTYLGDGSNWKIEIAISHENKILGTAGGMAAMSKFLSDEGPFFVCNGDILSEIILSELIAFHSCRGAMVTLALCDHPSKNNVCIDSGEAVVDFWGRRGAFQPGKHKNLAFTGISIVDPEILNLVFHVQSDNIIEVYLDLIKKKSGSVLGYDVKGTYWIDIGTPSSYLQAHHDILVNGKMNQLSKKNRQTSLHMEIGSIIETGARLEGFVSLGRDCLVKKNTFLKNCVVWNNSVVEEGTCLENGVIDGPWKYRIPYEKE